MTNRTMKMISSVLGALMLLTSTHAFAPMPRTVAMPSSTTLAAKYNSMEEILALFPEDKPVLMNFYDAATEEDIKTDIFVVKERLADKATLVSVKQQDYPEIAKLWDADQKSPSMILFKDGSPVLRIYEETNYLEILTKVTPFCEDD